MHKYIEQRECRHKNTDQRPATIPVKRSQQKLYCLFSSRGRSTISEPDSPRLIIPNGPRFFWRKDFFEPIWASTEGSQKKRQDKSIHGFRDVKIISRRNNKLLYSQFAWHEKKIHHKCSTFLTTYMRGRIHRNWTALEMTKQLSEWLKKEGAFNR